MSAPKPSANETPVEAASGARTTRLQRALADAMKIQEGPELLAKIANREFRDAFQAITVQQRGFTDNFDLSAVPTIAMIFDSAHPNDKTKLLYECKLGSAAMTPDLGKALKAMAAERHIPFSHKGEFTNDHWFKATTVTIQSRDLAEIVTLINDALIENVRPDAKVSYADVIRIAQEEIGRVLS